LGGAPLLATTFSNNFKTATDLSVQSYPSPGSAPQTGAYAVNTLGYGFWFGDASYHFAFSFPHNASSATVAFSSSLYEGKAEQARSTRDESWGPRQRAGDCPLMHHHSVAGKLGAVSGGCRRAQQSTPET